MEADYVTMVEDIPTMSAG